MAAQPRPLLLSACLLLLAAFATLSPPSAFVPAGRGGRATPAMRRGGAGDAAVAMRTAVDPAESGWQDAVALLARRGPRRLAGPERVLAAWVLAAWVLAAGLVAWLAPAAADARPWPVGRDAAPADLISRIPAGRMAGNLITDSERQDIQEGALPSLVQEYKQDKQLKKDASATAAYAKAHRVAKAQHWLSPKKLAPVSS